MPPPGHVFIAYAKEDRAAATKLCLALEDAGLTCWMSARDIAKGASRARAINEAIDASRAMLVVVSARTAGSARLMREIRRASDRNTAVVPVRIEDVAPAGDLEQLLSAADWIDAPDGATSAVVGRIVTSVIATARHARAPEPAPEPEPEPAPEPEPTLALHPEPEPEAEARAEPEPAREPAPIRPRPRPASSAPSLGRTGATGSRPTILALAGVGVLIVLVAVAAHLYRGNARVNDTARAVSATAPLSDADIVAAALPRLEAQGAAVPAERAVRIAAAAYAPERPIDTVRTVSFTDDGGQCAIHIPPGAGIVIFTTTTANTTAYVASIGASGSRLELRAALSGTPPAAAMHPLDSATAATGYAQVLTRWVTYVRHLGAP